MVYRRARSRRARRFIILTLALGAALLYPVLEQRRRDRGAVRLAAQEREREVLRLLVLDLAGQRRLVRVYVHVEQRRARVVERELDRAAQVARRPCRLPSR